MKLSIPRMRGASVLFAVAILAISAVAASGATRYDRQMTRQVLSKMHHVNQMEIRMGDLAMRKAQDPAVRDFGRSLRNDHQMSDRRVTSLAAQKGIRLMNPAPSPHERTMARRLRDARGHQFDRTFMTAMEDGHTQTIQELSQARRNLHDPATRRLVGNTLPALRHHRNMARQIHDQL